MITQTAWLDRKFVFDLPTGTFPTLLDRLRGTPARAEALVTGLPERLLAMRVNEKWSAKEHLAHLDDLTPLDDRRLNEFLNHVPVLSAADVENRSTETAYHRTVPVRDIIQKLTVSRETLVRRLEVLNEEQVRIIAIHPRLGVPMRLVDWVYFVAEHDDHHLAEARRTIAILKAKHFARSENTDFVREEGKVPNVH
jgi:DinB superfamily